MFCLKGDQAIETARAFAALSEKYFANHVKALHHKMRLCCFTILPESIISELLSAGNCTCITVELIS